MSGQSHVVVHTENEVCIYIVVLCLNAASRIAGCSDADMPAQSRLLQASVSATVTCSSRDAWYWLLHPGGPGRVRRRLKVLAGVSSVPCVARYGSCHWETSLSTSKHFPFFWERKGGGGLLCRSMCLFSI